MDDPVAASASVEAAGGKKKSKNKKQDKARRESAAVVKKWYRKDSNSVPVSYRLQSTHEKEAALSSAKWEKESGRLRTLFQQRNLSRTSFAEDSSADTAEEGRRASLSSTSSDVSASSVQYDAPQFEQSIAHMALEQALLHEGADGSKALVYQRTFTDIDEHESDALACDYLDHVDGHADKLDKKAKETQEALCELDLAMAVPQPNWKVSKLQWADGGLDPANTSHASYLMELIKDLRARLQFAVDSEACRPNLLEIDPVIAEAAKHAAFASISSDAPHLSTHGEEQKKKIMDLISDHSTDNKPIILYGQSGSGLTSVMKRVAQAASAWAKSQQALCVIRFVGVTPQSQNARTLLLTLCAQIYRLYGLGERAIPDDYASIVLQFHKCLTFATAEKPLYVFLDAVDQLFGSNNGHRIRWLPETLPEHVHLVLSTSDSLRQKAFAALQSKYSHPDPSKAIWVHLPDPKVELLETIVTERLQKKKRVLTHKQLSVVRKALAACPSMLYTQLVFERARKWASYTVDDALFLPPSVPELVHLVLVVAEKQTNPTAMKHAVGYLACSKEGLSEPELEDILSCDEDLLDAVYENWPDCPVRRVPPSLWSELSFAIKCLLTKQRVGSSWLLRWRHTAFREAAHLRYVSAYSGSNLDVSATRHSAIADYFLGVWHGTNKPYGNGSEAPRHVAPQPLIYETVSSTQLMRQTSERCGQSVPIQHNMRKLVELPHALAGAGRFDELTSECLCSPAWMVAKLQAMSFHALLEDYDLARDQPDGDQASLGKIRQALVMSHGLASEASQLPALVLARLLQLEFLDKFPAIQKLCANIRQWCTTSEHRQMTRGLTILPMPSWICLPVAGSPLEHTFSGHSHSVNCVASSHDGKLAFSGSADGTVQVVSTVDGEELMVLKCARDVTALASNGRDEILYVGLIDGSIESWLLDTMQRVSTLKAHTSEVTCIITNKTHVISGSVDGSIRIRKEQVTTKTLSRRHNDGVVCKTDPSPVICVAFSPDGENVVAGAQSGASVMYHVANGKTMRTFQAPKSPVYATRFTSDGKHLFTIAENGTISKFVTETAQPVEGYNVQAAEWCIAVSISPDASFAIVSQPDGMIRQFSMETGEEIWVFWGENFCEQVSVSSNGAFVLTSFKELNTVQQWKLSDPAPPVVFRGRAGTIRALAITSDGAHSIDAGDDDPTSLVVRGVKDFNTVISYSGQHQAPVCSAQVSSDDRIVVSAGGTSIHRWERETATQLGTLDVSSPIVCIDASPDAMVVAVGQVDGTVSLCDFSTSTVEQTTVFEVAVYAVGLVGDGRIACMQPDSLKVLESIAGTVQMTFRSARTSFTSMMVSPETGSVFTGTGSGWIQEWSLSTKRMLRKLEGHSDSVISLALCDAGFAVSCSDDQTVRVWDLEAGLSLDAFKFDLEMTAGIRTVVSSAASDKDFSVIVGTERGLMSALQVQYPNKTAELGISIISGVRAMPLSAKHFGPSVSEARQKIVSQFSRGQSYIDVDSSFFFASQEAVAVLSGDLAMDTSDMNVPRSVRVDVISSVSDTIHERAAILTKVVPYITKYAQEREVEFHLGMRWRNPATHSVDSRITGAQWMEDSLKACTLSPSLGFVVLATQKYGARALPDMITAEQFDLLAADKERKGGCVIC
eukprot:m.35483 g.35483  ORF g.35483 m.35483 type:complete len:1645 (+) comp10931_c0_seq1:360-5294(+)